MFKHSAFTSDSQLGTSTLHRASRALSIGYTTFGYAVLHKTIILESLIFLFVFNNEFNNDI
jgi:hypothetical protein